MLLASPAFAESTNPWALPVQPQNPSGGGFNMGGGFTMGFGFGGSTGYVPQAIAPLPPGYSPPPAPVEPKAAKPQAPAYPMFRQPGQFGEYPPLSGKNSATELKKPQTVPRTQNPATPGMYGTVPQWPTSPYGYANPYGMPGLYGSPYYGLPGGFGLPGLVAPPPW